MLSHIFPTEKIYLLPFSSYCNGETPGLGSLLENSCVGLREAAERPAGGALLLRQLRSEQSMPQRSVSEPALALEAQQLAILLDSSRELIAVLGSDGALLFANRSFRFAFGDRSEGLLGKQI